MRKTLPGQKSIVSVCLTDNHSITHSGKVLPMIVCKNSQKRI